MRDHEQRIRELERALAQQNYCVAVLLVVSVVVALAVAWLWNERGAPNFDHIAVSLSAFQVLFGIAAVYGFWALRGLTREKAEEVAEATTRTMVEKLAREELSQIAPSLIQRAITEYLETRHTEAHISDDAARGMREAFGVKEGGDGK